ncbi:transcription elongation factor GreA [Streptohalobacillus salinus]|uniref:Transcription elongation factor GreA n=1 Tax=Streptohalobacillus salinus TaxID=621096 RepID=A0A2V3WAW2_9BACI|nr:transcription elongation factor GreA [Streptohalobacillus salinus]PXW91593.1 transcription elongation factor GreA [Streptohalobacillus salinus]
MASDKSYYMTQEGLEKLNKELEHLKSVRRPEVVERIKVARDFGDLSENSEYDAAKDDQAFVEARITQVETMIRNAKIIEKNDADSTTVQLGRKVIFQELPDGDKEEYVIVGSAEADPFEGKISNDSPIAKALIGCEVGQEVSVPTPGGDMRVKIIEVK